jgi:hypothetical protein
VSYYLGLVVAFDIFNVAEVEGFDSRVNIRTDGSIKENVPEGENALGGSSSKQKKEQKKSKNESDQEETFHKNIRKLINISKYIYEQLPSFCGVMVLTYPEIF